MNFLLPQELTHGAVLRGNEYAWEPLSFPLALEKAPRLGYACLGGQFWFLSPDNSVYELYWLEADSKERTNGELWTEYSQRSCKEVLARFNSLLKDTIFFEEARNFATLSYVSSSDELRAKFRVLFNAQFVDESDYSSLPGS